MLWIIIKMRLSLLNVFGEAVKEYYYFFNQISTFEYMSFNICDEMGSILNLVLLQQIKVVSRRSICAVLSRVSQAAAIFMEHHFYLKEWLKDKLWFFRLGCFVDIFLKIKFQSSKEKQLTLFVTNDKIQTYKVKIGILEKLYSSLWLWHLPGT